MQSHLQWSSMGAVLRRPRTTFTALAKTTPLGWRAAAVHALGYLCMLATMVAYTATGRLAPFETVSAVVSFAYMPFAHLLGVALAWRLWMHKQSFAHVYALYTFGYGPACLVLLGISATCLLAETPGSQVGWMGLALLASLGWGSALTCLGFRHGACAPWRKAVYSMLLIHLVTIVFGAGLFAVAGQLFSLIWAGK
jgi:hypothetical protein